MANTYTVKKGDTLSALAVKFGTTVAKLVELNNIDNPDLIIIGQVLKLDGESTTPATNKTSKATIKLFGLQSNTERTLYASWTWSKTIDVFGITILATIFGLLAMTVVANSSKVHIAPPPMQSGLNSKSSLSQRPI